MAVFKNFYSRHKELFLKISSMLLVMLFFGVIEVVVRILFPVKALDNMIDLGPINLFSKQVIKGETWYRISNKNAYSDRNILFKEKKGENQIRIICLGGSASAGWPHPPEEIYSRYLEKTLQKVYPQKEIEIINCSAHGFASYRVRQVFETIIPFDPDAIIIWSGNNEFLEKRNYRTSALKNALVEFRNNFRTLQVVRQLFVKHRYDDTPDVAETFWKKVNEEALELRRDPQQFEKVKEHFEKSIEGIVGDARKHRIRAMLMTVPANLRDWEPNVSYLGLNESDSSRWADEFAAGKKAYLRLNYMEAIDKLASATRMAPLHAETMLWLARAYEGAHDTLTALRYYTQAKDADYNPFRAISAFNTTLRNLARVHPDVVLLDMEQKINQYAKRGIPGFDLFLDYVHPTKEGNLAVAYEAANQIIKSDLFDGARVSEQISLRLIRKINESDYRDEDDPYVQFTRFALCCITHQYASALLFGRKIKSGIPPDALLNDPSGRVTLLNDAINAFQPYVDLEEKSVYEESTIADREKVRKDIRSFYEKHFPYGAF